MALSDFFKKKQPAADLSRLGTDIHSHFIPGIDDGAATIEDSLELIRGMVSLGYRKLITTPHVISDSYRNTPEIIGAGLQKVREAVTGAGINIQVDAAAEYYLDHDFLNKLRENKLLTFGGIRKYLLWEISFMSPPDTLQQMVFDMQTLGYKPVLAHVERYGFWHRNYQMYEELSGKGILLQLNIMSLTGHYGHETKKAAQWLIDHDLISFLGSDCHHAGHINLIKSALNDRHLAKALASFRLLNASL